jgi:hypothetical protein
MSVDMKISASLDSQVHQRVSRQCFEHVIKEADTRLDPTLSGTIEGHMNVKVRLLRRSGNLSYPLHAGSRLETIS